MRAQFQVNPALRAHHGRTHLINAVRPALMLRDTSLDILQFLLYAAIGVQPDGDP